MKNSIKKMIIVGLLAGLLFPAYGVCSSPITLHVLKVGTYGNGNLYLSLDQSIDEVGCAMAYIELPANSPALKMVLAAATLAIATNATVDLKTDGCINGVPSFMGSRQGYFGVNKL